MGFLKATLMVSCALFGLVACTTQPVVTLQDQAAQQSRLASLENFSFRGGLGIWTDEQTQSARLSWLQRNGELTIDLSGPLGLGDLKLKHDGALAVLTRSGKTVGRGNSVDSVLQNGLGLAAPVPVLQLQQWVKGLPGESNSVKRDEQGKIVSLRYTDEQGTAWKARFLRYTAFDGLQLPSLITASGGPYSVRLVLKDWQLIAPLEPTEETPDNGQSNKRLAIPSR